MKDHVGEIIFQECLGVAYSIGQETGYSGCTPVINKW